MQMLNYIQYSLHFFSNAFKKIHVSLIKLGLLFMDISVLIIKLSLFGKHNGETEKKAAFSVSDETAGTLWV